MVDLTNDGNTTNPDTNEEEDVRSVADSTDSDTILGRPGQEDSGSDQEQEEERRQVEAAAERRREEQVGADMPAHVGQATRKAYALASGQLVTDHEGRPWTTNKCTGEVTYLR